MSEERAMMEGPGSNEQGDASSTKYRGVRKRKWGKWVSEIRLPNSRERIWLGSYDSAEKAARAFDAALFCLRGRDARFNFPNDPPNIAGGRDLAPAEIQVAAARFANSPPEPQPSSCPGLAACLVPQTESSYTSEGTVAGMDHDFGMYTDVSFWDPNRYEGGSVYYDGSDYGIFPGFDDLNNNYFGTHMMNESNYGEDNYDGVFVQDFPLWNF